MPIQQILLGAGGVAAVEVNASNATNVVLASVFGSDWSDSVDKVYNVPNGVTIGATGSNAAILASSGMGGSLVINVSGTVIAVHGSGGGGGAKGIGAQTNNNVRTGDDGQTVSVTSSTAPGAKPSVKPKGDLDVAKEQEKYEGGPGFRNEGGLMTKGKKKKKK